MANYPSLPLFTDAYLGDTRHLTTLQHGAYLLMLIVAWRSPDCSLPNDDAYLARITGLDKRTWNANKDTLLAFWKLGPEQKWEQGRLKDERNFVEQLRNKNVANANTRWLKNKKPRHATAIPERCQNDAPTLTPTPTPEVSEVGKPTSPPTPKAPNKVGLAELSVDHIAGWLAEKRAQGRYLLHDEHFILEQFKNYCQSKGKKYADYIAGYRNAFEWERCQPQRQQGTVGKKSEWIAEGDRLAAKYRAQAELERQGQA